MIFNFNEGSLEISSEWEDKSLILLTHQSGLSISISRDKLPLGMTVDEFIELELDKISEQLRNYQETYRGPIVIDRFDGVLSEFNWSSPQGKMYQMSAIIKLPIHPIMITASSLSIITNGQRKLLLAIIESFKAR